MEDLERGGVVERSEKEEMLEWVVERGQDADERESGRRAMADSQRRQRVELLLLLLLLLDGKGMLDLAV